MNRVSRAWLVFATILAITSIASKSWVPFAITVGILFLVILLAFVMGRKHKPKPDVIFVDNSKFEDPDLGDSKWMH